uniref:Secreted protein n=1 Tax=Anopheles farauti TaxID=69004 RepID=A0A182QBI0_9DIPT
MPHGLALLASTLISFTSLGPVPDGSDTDEGVRFSGPLLDVLEAGEAPGGGAVCGWWLAVVRLSGANGGPLPEAFDISGLILTGNPLWAPIVAPNVRWYDSSSDTSGEPGARW